MPSDWLPLRGIIQSLLPEESKEEAEEKEKEEEKERVEEEGMADEGRRACRMFWSGSR